jgi:hypothetical protein
MTRRKSDPSTKSHPSNTPHERALTYGLINNLQTARALGIEVPSGLLAIADEVIESVPFAALREAGFGPLRRFAAVQ